MRRIAIVPILALLGACNTTSEAPQTVAAEAPAQRLEPGTPPKPAVVAAIKVAAGQKLKDPYTAQYERMLQAVRPNARGEPTDVVCGYINAKNSFGAYIGARPFVYFVERKDLVTTGDSAIPEVMSDILKRFCAGLI